MYISNILKTLNVFFKFFKDCIQSFTMIESRQFHRDLPDLTGYFKMCLKIVT